MEIPENEIRYCILIRGTRSSTDKTSIESYCEKYGAINYSRCAIDSQNIIRGYNVVFLQQTAVNKFMDARPHRIDGQLVKVKRCLSLDEELKLTDTILVTISDTIDSSNDNQIFDEQILRDYFSKYGIPSCNIDTHHERPCAYLTFADYDRVDQLINDKPHIIGKIPVNVKKYIEQRSSHSNGDYQKKTSRISNYHHRRSTSPSYGINRKHQRSFSRESEHDTIKRSRRHPIHMSTSLSQHDTNSFENPDIDYNPFLIKSDPIPVPLMSKILIKQEPIVKYQDNDLVRLKNANEMLLLEVQSLISSPPPPPTLPSIVYNSTTDELCRLQIEQDRLAHEMRFFQQQQNNSDKNNNQLLMKLKTDLENLLVQVNILLQGQIEKKEKTFADELFEKYTIEYILSLNETDVKQRLEQLEKENQLLLLIMQNMPKKPPTTKCESV